MNIYRTNIRVSLSTVVFVVLTTTTVVLLYLYAYDKVAQKWAPIVGGMAISVLVSLIQFAINFKSYRNSEKLEDVGIKEFLKTRGDKNYYSKLIENANKEFHLIFHTSKRFFEDFCQDEPGDNLLVKKLDSNVDLTVKILLLHQSLLACDDQPSFDISLREIQRLAQKYHNRFEVRYYMHEPNHNLFLTDNDAIIGPYFTNAKGKYLPSIHFKANASFVAPYRDYFAREWDNAKSNN
jgi:hypothetical protein